MFDISMAEMAVIGVVALIVVGPKDLPGMFRRVGQFAGRMRAMARDFQRAMDQAADDSGLSDVAKTVRTAATMKNLGLDDAAKSLAAVNEDWKARQDAGKIDPAAEHAARQQAVKDANRAAEEWAGPDAAGVEDPAVKTAPEEPEEIDPRV
ncbi:MAG: twin-arginine translocase subunit TatB [Rhodobacteraceae bacterium]|nr:twin-arginine translocase subunit TatB [Paracoccaceae bacterium]